VAVGKKLMYKYLLFDADGTILDYDRAEENALNQAAAASGYSVTDDIREVYRKINSQLWAMLEKGLISSEKLRVLRFEKLAEASAWNNLDAADFSKLYLKFLADSGFMINGAMQMLNNLPSETVKVIITNGIKDIQISRLTKAGIIGMFDAVIISEEAGVPKPAGEFFDYTLKKINYYEKSEMLVIGDSLSSDIAGGIDYGIDTCWFNPSGKENTTSRVPDYEISSWNDFFEIIK